MLDPYEDPYAAFVEERLLGILGEIKELVENNGGVLVLISMPFGGYFPSQIRGSFSRMGFELPPLDFTKMDELVKNLAGRLGIQCIVMSDELRLRKDLSNIWYQFDGHLTEYGNEVVAEHIFEALSLTRAEISSIDAKNRQQTNGRELDFGSAKCGEHSLWPAGR